MDVARSVRERMEQHRKNPVCASCHLRVMHPIGFALENFDAVGSGARPATARRSIKLTEYFDAVKFLADNRARLAW